MTVEESAASGRAFARKAAEYEVINPQAARSFYLKAAKSFNDAAHLSSNSKDRQEYEKYSRHFFSLSKSCQPVAVPAGFEDEPEQELVLAEIPNVSFDDIGGLTEAKEQIKRAIIYPFTHKDVYEHYKIGRGGGILLYGPPGTGKTMLAKAAAKECGAAFISVKTSDIMSKFVGESEKHIKKIFEEARQHEKSIIFFDEIDSIAGRRGDAEGFAKRIVNELLAQMDGVEGGTDALIMAATNEPWEIDPALRRPGRFGTLIHVKEPDAAAREAIFKLNLKDRPCIALDYTTLAALTEGYSGADISAICQEAAYIPLSEALTSPSRRDITMDDIMFAVNHREASTGLWYAEAERMVRKYGDTIKIR